MYFGLFAAAWHIQRKCRNRVTGFRTLQVDHNSEHMSSKRVSRCRNGSISLLFNLQTMQMCTRIWDRSEGKVPVAWLGTEGGSARRDRRYPFHMSPSSFTWVHEFSIPRRTILTCSLHQYHEENGPRTLTLKAELANKAPTWGAKYTSISRTSSKAGDMQLQRSFLIFPVYGRLVIIFRIPMDIMQTFASSPQEAFVDSTQLIFHLV
jgi:hypothetical protein